MKKGIIVVFVVLAAAVVVALISSSSQQTSTTDRDFQSRSTAPPVARQTPRVPAHFKDASSASPLKITLDPELFDGKIRQAYQVAREIPETLAQLPCYCYCDQGFGHKSLHSCYESDHSAHCSTCVDEALMAYQLQKGQQLSPAQIRERIVTEFSK